MQPKIIFLGTGGDSIVVGKQLRSAGGIIVQVLDNQIHINPGPGAVARAYDYGVNLRNNIAVLVSNNYLNNVAEINSVISAMSLGGLDRKGVLISNKSAYENYENNDPMINNYYKNFLEKDIVLENGKRVGLNELEIKATRTLNEDEYAIGFKIITPKFSIGYTSDTGYIKNLSEDFKGVEIMIFNCTSPSETPGYSTLTPADIIQILPKIKPKLAVITGFGIKMHHCDVLNEARKIQKETGIQTIAASDGMSINPVSYSVNLRQRTLQQFNG
ncbi:MAG: MBL fold metallo-hydrolase [Candidatus Nanoarchaeia archaeon]